MSVFNWTFHHQFLGVWEHQKINFGTSNSAIWMDVLRVRFRNWYTVSHIGTNICCDVRMFRNAPIDIFVTNSRFADVQVNYERGNRGLECATPQRYWPIHRLKYDTIMRLVFDSVIAVRCFGIVIDNRTIDRIFFHESVNLWRDPIKMLGNDKYRLVPKTY